MHLAAFDELATAEDEAEPSPGGRSLSRTLGIEIAEGRAGEAIAISGHRLA